MLAAAASVWAIFKLKQGADNAINAISPTADGISKTTASISKTLNSDLAVKKALTPFVQSQANLLYGHLRGFTIMTGSRNEAIKKILDSMKTKEMVKALYLAYGERPTFDNWDFFGFKSHDMIYALRLNMSEDDFQKYCYKALHLGGFL